MKHTCSLLLVIGLLTACSRTETAQETTQTTTAPADSAVTTSPVPKPENCRSIVAADKLGKADTYGESAKSVTIQLTLNQDTGTMSTAEGCYFNNAVTVLATKKSGSQLFKRTLLKDDLLYFIKGDEAIQQAILQTVTYKPTFNGLKYFTLTMRLMEPGSKKTLDYTVFMNYFGEIVKVR